MHNEFTNKSENEGAITPCTQNQLIKSRCVIIAGEINQQLAEKSNNEANNFAGNQ